MIKYSYCIDDKDELVDIKSLSNATRHARRLYCLSCGQEMIPNLGTKKAWYFSHKADCACDGESYLHKLAKRVIKNKFDTEPTFLVEYEITKECSNVECKYRNYLCRKEFVPYRIDLKKYYDTCTEEASINGFVADLLLTDSKNPQKEPILIEICVTHPCNEEKIKSGLRIIEIKIGDEQDIFDVQSKKEICEWNTWSKKENYVKFISFKKEYTTPLQIKIQRYIYIPEHNLNGFLTEVDCKNANYKLRTDSSIELNVVNKRGHRTCEIPDMLLWMSKYNGMRRCNLCKFYYSTHYEQFPICRLSKKYGKPVHPSMDEAERCRSYREENAVFYNPNDYFIEGVTLEPLSNKPEYKVILAACRSFNNYDLFKEKIRYYLSDIIKKYSLVVITGFSKQSDTLITRLSEELMFLKEPFKTEWDKYGQDKRKAIDEANDKMTSSADALIAFWDGKSVGIKNLIEHAKQKKIKMAVIVK